MKLLIAVLSCGACEEAAAPPPAPPSPAPQAAPIVHDAAHDDALVDAPEVYPVRPRLMTTGFEGMSAKEMASVAAVERAFPSTRVELHDPPQLTMFEAGGTDDLATVYIDDAGHAYKAMLHGPGITTMHGLAVGAPLADVLALKTRRRCESMWGITDSFAVPKGVVRCWVGAAPAKFRYVTSLDHRAPRPPREGVELERWIAASGTRVELVIWYRKLASEDRATSSAPAARRADRTW